MNLNSYSPTLTQSRVRWVRHDQLSNDCWGPAQLSGARSDPRWKSSPTQRAI